MRNRNVKGEARVASIHLRYIDEGEFDQPRNRRGATLSLVSLNFYDDFLREIGCALQRGTLLLDGSRMGMG
jgi:hypothetical protein